MLHGKVAIVTGAGQGIGQGIAYGLADKGAIVVVADKNLQTAEGTVAELTSRGKEALAVKVDISIPGEVADLVSTVINKFGHIDILVNNAGIVFHAPITETTDEQWDKVLSVNLKGPFLCGQAVAREMIKQGGGKIINIASASAHSHVPRMAAYAASKAGIFALTRAMAVEWAQYNITTNSISPGSTNTPLMQSSRKQVPLKFDRARRIPLGRIGQVQDVVNLVTFLASPESGYINGQDIIIDGGQRAIHPGFVQA